MIKVYVAGPYGRRAGISASEQMQNVYETIGVAVELLRKGYNPFVPHVYGFIHNIMEPPLSEEAWLSRFLEWVTVCDCLLRLPGMSEGSDSEISHARSLGKPVFYSVEGLDLWSKGR